MLAARRAAREGPERPVGIPESDPLEDAASDGVLERLARRYASITLARPGTYGVIMWEPASDRMVSLNPNERFYAASIGKLPALLTLYRAAAEGGVDLDERVTMLPSDIRSYGSGVLQGRPAGTVLTLRECAYYLIKESDNTAWAILNRYLGTRKIQAQLRAIGAGSTDYSRYTTTPNDVLLILEKICDPEFASCDLSTEMLSLMTDTAFEARLPAGLPEGVRIAHKTGSYGASFGDAGVVFAGDAGRYFIAVLSKDTDEEAARAVMREISLATYRALVDDTAQPLDHPRYVTAGDT